MQEKYVGLWVRGKEKPIFTDDYEERPIVVGFSNGDIEYSIGCGSFKDFMTWVMKTLTETHFNGTFFDDDLSSNTE